MAYKDMREFIATLEKHGETQRIEQEVNWNLEAGAIARKVNERGLPAPFFQKIKDYPGWRMFAGTLSTFRRINLALGLDPDTPPRETMEVYNKRSLNLIKPRLVKDAPCKENIYTGDQVNLFKLPAPMVHEGDGGRYLCTWHFQVNKDPDTGWVNWGMYRQMIQTKNTLGILIEVMQHIGEMYFRIWEPKNQPMPMAVAIGPEPVCTLVAAAKVPRYVNEADVAGGLRGEPVDVVKCETVDLEVPATSEIVIEGVVPPKERIMEGAFGEYTGYRASPRDPRPFMKVTAITYRNDPILTFSNMGVPVDESHITQALTHSGELLRQLQALQIPGLRDVWVPPECASHVVIVSVKVPYHGIAQKISSAVWGTESGNLIPYVIVCEDDIDVHDIWQVMHAITTKCHPYRGINRIEHAFGNLLYPALSREERLGWIGAKVCFDCTWPTDWDPSIAVPPRSSFDNIYSKEVQEHVLKNWKNYGYKEL